jgi:hypothetical protein
MISIISLRAAAGPDALRPVDLQQEYRARARQPALYETYAARANRRKAVDHAGRIATFGSCRNEMIFGRAVRVGCSRLSWNRVAPKALATDDAPRRLVLVAT